MRKYRRYILVLRFVLALLVVGTLGSCSSAKFLSDGEYLLNKVDVNPSDKTLKEDMFSGCIRQSPNYGWFFYWLKVPLGVYLMSGKSDSWMNRMLRRLGEAPVVYDMELAQRSLRDLEQTLHNRGYLGATVNLKEDYKGHKVNLTFQLNEGKVYRVDSVNVEIDDAVIAQKLEPIMGHSLLKPNMVFDINVLDNERERITQYLRENGYYKFNKDYITYTADTIQGSKGLGLTMHLMNYKTSKEASPTEHPIYTIDSVFVVTEFDAANLSNG
ncbi:MAG: hypothetical protein IKU98_04120, partial [Bacteroidaceae bacterium]|nr:hypothetical protein [Bacteroidaceae bacterium]